MMGYDISWAAFNMIEVMSSTKFTYKVSHSPLGRYSFYGNMSYHCLNLHCAGDFPGNFFAS